jgi:hypothetical protein
VHSQLRIDNATWLCLYVAAALVPQCFPLVSVVLSITSFKRAAIKWKARNSDRFGGNWPGTSCGKTPPPLRPHRSTSTPANVHLNDPNELTPAAYARPILECRIACMTLYGYALACPGIGGRSTRNDLVSRRLKLHSIATCIRNQPETGRAAFAAGTYSIVNAR